MPEGADDAVEPHARVEAGDAGADQADHGHVEQQVGRPAPAASIAGGYGPLPAPSRRRACAGALASALSSQGRRQRPPGQSARPGPGTDAAQARRRGGQVGGVVEHDVVEPVPAGARRAGRRRPWRTTAMASTVRTTGSPATATRDARSSAPPGPPVVHRPDDGRPAPRTAFRPVGVTWLGPSGADSGRRVAVGSAA